MSIAVTDLIERLSELPPGWKAEATKAGGSIEVWDPEGAQYGYVFTGTRSTRLMVDRRKVRDAE
jgi:hypothetical protein